MGFLEGMSERRVVTHAAAGAYYLFMSLVPMTMLIGAALQFTPFTQDTFMTLAHDYLPESLYQLVDQILTAIYSGGATALTVSLLLTVWSASAAVKAIMRGMNAVYDVEKRPPFHILSLKAMLYMLVFVASVILSLVVMVYGGKILDLVYILVPRSDALDYILYMIRPLRFLVTMAFLTIVFMALYRWMPAKKLKYRNQWAGALFTAVSWVLFSLLFSLYVTHSNRFGAYGLIGTIMVAMMWMQICIMFLLLGGYINRYIEIRQEAALQAVEEKWIGEK